MRTICKKASKLLLMGLLITLLLVSAVVADEQVSLIFNGQEYQADVYVEKGVSYVSVESLVKIPGLEVEQEGYVPLRKFFEDRKGNVNWNNKEKHVIVSWRQTNDEWSADKLMIESSRVLEEINTYKMKGNVAIKMNISAPDALEIPEIPEITTTMEGEFQQEPLSMYIKQTMDLPVSDTLLSEEESDLFQQGSMVTEMVWTDNAIYQKMPLSDQWIVQDLSNMDMMGQLTEMLQATPQQSLETMRKFGIVYVFGEDVVIDGKEYYTVKNYVDSATFKKVMEEFNIAGLLSDTQGLTEQTEQNDEVVPESAKEMQQIFDQLLASMEVNYYVDSLISKETLLTEGMLFDMNLKYAMDETVNPEGPINIEMKMTGEFELNEFGTEVQLPDVSNAITQEEYLEQIINEMEVPEE
ncbi:MAG: DUF6612 family protein [Dehalobacterium sp.]